VLRARQRSRAIARTDVVRRLLALYGTDEGRSSWGAGVSNVLRAISRPRGAYIYARSIENR
jgi:hypothetical protein